MALNVLRDVTFSFIPGGADDGAFASGGTPLVVKIDTVTISQTNTLDDHSTAQDETPLNRITKKPWLCTCDTKMSRTGSTGLENLLVENELIAFTAIAAGNTTLDIEATSGIVGNIEFNYSGPNTVRFEIHPYGEALSLAFNGA